MSQRVARPVDQLQASRFQKEALSTGAQQPSTTGEEQFVQGYSDPPRKTFSHHLSQLEVPHTTIDQVTRGETSTLADGEGEGGANDKAEERQEIRKMRYMLSSNSERIVASKIEQLEVSQLKSPQLRELVRRLKDLLKIEIPQNDNSPPGMQNPYADFQVGKRWQEIQGCNQWAGLLDPIDPILRAEIVRYGEFAQAAYDAFDKDTSSKYCGSSKYSKEDLFKKVGLENRGYEITQFLYATTELSLPHFFSKSFLDDKWSKDSNWIGFVAVCTCPKEIARLGRRDIVVAWRGTATKFEWIKDVQDYLAPAGFDPRHGNKDVCVESGFLSVYKSNNEKSRYNGRSAREQALGAIRDLVEKYKLEDKETPLSITVTGHSLGSALAVLCGYDVAESQINLLSETSPIVPKEWDLASSGPGSGPARVGSLAKTESMFPTGRIPITVYTFAGPRVGNRAFKNRTEKLGVAVLRVANKHDQITKVPGVIFTHLMEVVQKIITSAPSYKHVGVKLKIDHLVSPFLQPKTDPIRSHNLEAYLHVVDGFHGKKLPFKPTMRDYALVNKHCEFLKDEFHIPPAWWQEAYKGLVRDKDGHWMLPPRPQEIFPPSPEECPEEIDQKTVEETLEEPYRAFERSVTIAFERSSSKSGYVSIAAPHTPYDSESDGSGDSDDDDMGNDAMTCESLVGSGNIVVDGATTQAPNSPLVLSKK